jgi:hypothetical protein
MSPWVDGFGSDGACPSKWRARDVIVGDACGARARARRRDSLVWHADDRDRMHRVIAAWTQRFSDPHLPTTLQRRLQAAGFDVDAVQTVPVLNADFDANTDSARHIEIISDFVTGHGIPRDDAFAWADDLHERARLAEYFFSLNRYVFTACKP